MNTRPLTRRSFLTTSAAAGAGLLIPWKASLQRAFAAYAAANSLDPTGIPKYQLPMIIPPAMPQVWQSNRNIDYFEICVRQFQQQILPTGYPQTTVWSYGSSKDLGTFNFPAFTIEARANRPTYVKWINDLVDNHGYYLPHLLPVDQTLHWANPPGGNAGRDTRPTFSSTPGPYTGPVPIVTHVHGAVGVGDESDGYAEAWYLPAARNIPRGYAREGTWYNFFKGKFRRMSGTAWERGQAEFMYPNLDRASTNWYHDHTLGMTRLNVYAGPAGFYLIRGGPADVALDTRTGASATLPGPAPVVGSNPFGTFYEIPIAIQDRSFKPDGSLFYPDTRAFFDGIAGPYVPFSDISPIWNPEFFGNTMVVNGRTWPYQEVEQRRYRLRLLNGCNSRFLILDFSQIPGVEVWQIGNEGGFLPAPVNLSAVNSNQLLMGLAERADLIVDFTNVPVGNYVLGNLGPDEPFGGGTPGVDFPIADPNTTGQVMEFRVRPSVGADSSTPPQFLQLPPIAPLPAETTTRPLALIEEMSTYPGFDGPAEALLGTVNGGIFASRLWMDPVTENPGVGDTEVWEIYNFTGDGHPMHVHEVTFEVVNRQALEIDPVTEEPVQPVQLAGSPRPPEVWEAGRKDTVIAYPGEVTRIRATFNVPGQYVWHCHIVEHEDNEMMRPYRVGPEQRGQPS